MPVLWLYRQDIPLLPIAEGLPGQDPCQVWPLITHKVPYLNQRPPPSLAAPSLQVSSARKDLGSVANSKALESLWPPALISSPSRATICLLSASLSWNLSLILSHVRHLSLCRPSASSGGVSCFALSPQLSALASPEGCLAPSHTSRAGIRSGARSFFLMGISLAAAGPALADCWNLSSRLVFPAIPCTRMPNQARDTSWGHFTPGYGFLPPVRRKPVHILPSKAHPTANSRSCPCPSPPCWHSGLKSMKLAYSLFF